jgi:outer membrane protein OmpA-like peptidoglycan-associated protein
MANKKNNSDNYILIGAFVLVLGLGAYLYYKSKQPKVNPEEVLNDVFDNLTFDTGKATIKESSFPYLDKLVELLVKKPTWKLNILGHTDNKGGDALNLALSKNRALAVKTYLVGKTIAGDRITTDGFGATKPIADNNTPEGREKNRRVEFFIIKV